MKLTAAQIAADLELARQYEAQEGMAFLTYTRRARTALPEYAEALREAMNMLEWLRYWKSPDGVVLVKDLVEYKNILAAYHAQEVPK